MARGSILKMGRRLAVGEVSIYSEHDDELVAHVACTYAMPSDGRVEGNGEGAK